MSMESLGATWTFPSIPEIVSFLVAALVGTTTFIFFLNHFRIEGPKSLMEIIYWPSFIATFVIGNYDLGWMFHVQAVFSLVFLVIFIRTNRVK